MFVLKNRKSCFWKTNVIDILEVDEEVEALEVGDSVVDDVLSDKIEELVVIGIPLK